MTTKEEPEVICVVCELYDPHAWKKNVCRNCFHNEEAHIAAKDSGSGEKSDTKGDGKSKSKVEEKSDTLKRAKSTEKDKKPPQVLPKTKPKESKDEGIGSKDTKGVMGLKNVSKDTFSKTVDTPKKPGDKSKIDTTKTKDTIPDNKSTSEPETAAKKSDSKTPSLSIADKFKQNIESKQKSKVGPLPSSLLKKSDKISTVDKKVEGQVPSDTSQSSKLTTTKPDGKSVASEPKSGQKCDNKATPTETKVFTNSKLADSALLLQDKSKSIDKNSPSKQQDKNKATEIDKHKESTSLKDSKLDKVSDLKSEKSESKSDKLKFLSKNFTKDKDGETSDPKFNSLGRKKLASKETDANKQQIATGENKADIKPTSSPLSAISQKVGSKTDSSTTSPTSTGVNNTNASPFTKDANKNVSKPENKFKFGTSKWERGSKGDNEKVASLEEEKSKVNNEVELLRKKLAKMENKCTTLETDNVHLKAVVNDKEKQDSNFKMQKQDVENLIKELKGQLGSMSTRCSKLEGDNNTLMDQLKDQQTQQKEQQRNSTDEETTNAIRDIGETVIQSESMLEELQEENVTLQTEIQELKVEMDEMYDSFRDQEAEEFRDLQRELEITAKNCRILQFKLRKAERKNDQISNDRKEYEDKLHMLQNQFEDGDAKAHIRSLEDELQMAKEVSVRLHDELDLLDERRSKCEDENMHLTDILEKSDKKQFRLEMEIDRLKEQVCKIYQLHLLTFRGHQGRTLSVVL